MKAYIDDKDRIRLFRPEMNMQRLNSSCEALFFPYRISSSITVGNFLPDAVTILGEYCYK